MSINEVANNVIPIQVLYNTLLLNMQINNIKDYISLGTTNRATNRRPNSTSFKIETLGLREILQQLDKLMSKVCLEKNIQFILLDETPEDQVIINDKNKLYRVLVNYINNSITNTMKGYV